MPGAAARWFVASPVDRPRSHRGAAASAVPGSMVTHGSERSPGGSVAAGPGIARRRGPSRPEARAWRTRVADASAAHVQGGPCQLRPHRGIAVLATAVTGLSHRCRLLDRRPWKRMSRPVDGRGEPRRVGAGSAPAATGVGCRSVSADDGVREFRCTCRRGRAPDGTRPRAGPARRALAAGGGEGARDTIRTAAPGRRMRLGRGSGAWSVTHGGRLRRPVAERCPQTTNAGDPGRRRVIWP